MDDRPAVLAASTDPEILRWRHRPPADPWAAEEYIRGCAGGWAREERLTWAVCEPTTGEMLGEVELGALDLRLGVADAACWALPSARGRGMTTTALSAVLRFAFLGLGVERVGYSWAVGNDASGRVAAKCGFVTEGVMRSAWLDGDERVDVVVTGLLAADAVSR